LPALTPMQGMHAAAWTGTRATVFGLSVHASGRIPFLEGASDAPSERRLDLTMDHREPVELRLSDAAGAICTRRAEDGAECFRIEADPREGYLLWGRDRGSYLLSRDGRRLRCAPGDCAPEVWERFLIGQVLPFAGLVSGLEIFHASAIALDGRAVALAGPSGAGKTSVALAMCDGGAGFMADDVLALETRAGELLAHPGTPLAGVDRREDERRREAGRIARGEALMSNPREHLVRMRTGAEVVPLHALFFLDRRADGPGDPRFESVTDSQTLLCATFNFALATPERLRGLLDVCALASRGRVERIVAGPATDASGLGAAIMDRLSASR
jgi:hypothetical protein